MQGEFRVSGDPSVVLTTLLGSCVATCMFDPVARVGGMNHFLLATAPGNGDRSERYGLHAMEMLINGLMKTGARKDRLQAKLFGGAAMEGRMAHIGRENTRFATEFLDREGIACLASSLGGCQGRRLRFAPTTGAVRQLLMDDPPPLRPIDTRPAEDTTFFEE